MNNSEKFWDKLSKNYDKKIAIDHVEKYHSYNYLIKYLNAESNVLDFGCATGTLALSLADKAKNIHGIDLSSKMIQIAQQRKEEIKIDNITFFQSTIFDDRLKKES